MDRHDRDPAGYRVSEPPPGIQQEDVPVPDGRVIRALVAEHVHLLRLGLSAYLSREPAIEVIAEIEDGEDLATAVSELRPAVAIVDIDLPPGDGRLPALDIREAAPQCALVLLVDRDDASALGRAMAVRPCGLLSKEVPADLLTRCVRQVVAGKRVIDPTLSSTTHSILANPLTPRELEVLRIAADGATTAEIAARLSLSVKTVRNHLSSVITRIAARNRIDAIRIANEHSWL